MIELPGESRYVRVGNIDTHQVVAGEGPPLLLLHGLGASVITWRDNIGPLSRAFRVYALDLPGHGDSDKPDIDYSADTVVQFLLGFVESLGIERPRMIGNSIGGALALITALRHPDLVDGLVLVDSGGLGREVPLYVRLVSVPGLGELLESSKVGGTRFMLYNVFHDRSFVTQDLLDELYRCRQMPGAKEAVVRAVRNTVNLMGVRTQYVLVDALKSLDLPLMLVGGAEDRILPVSHAYRAAEAAPHARLEVYDGCGHWPHMERAADFNRAVVEFLPR